MSNLSVHFRMDYIYIVIPGSGSGADVVAPRICVADGESPKDFYKIMDL